MNARRGAGRVLRTGTEIVQRRIAWTAGMVAAAVGGVFAIGGCAIAAVLGNGPGPLAFLGIVVGVALAGFLVVRAILIRIDVTVLAAFVARRVTRRRH